MKGGTRATAFGLDIQADADLPFLAGSAVRPTGRLLELALAESADGLWPDPGELISDQRLPDEGGINFQIARGAEHGYRIWGPSYGTHVLSADGRRLRGAPGEDGLATWQRLLIAQALPFAAVLQGLEVLHASAVAVDGDAIAFAGLSGSGKTSLALDLCRHGAEFLADDVIALELGEQLLVHPGAPVAGVVEDGRETIEQVLPWPEPLPLRRVFLLERGPDGPAAPNFEPNVEAQELIASTFNLVLADPARLARLLEVCALAAASTVERVRVGPGVDAGELGAAVRERIGLSA
ncbi:MAG TPA: hypothetical protein VG816_09105 [Solirubrobacterales bacterium]|nr:hypothetical protein [Solirubrobacterales bacterium]